MRRGHIHTPLLPGIKELARASTLDSHGNLSKPLQASTLQFPHVENEDANKEYLCYWFPKGFLRARWDDTREVLKYYPNVILSLAGI